MEKDLLTDSFDHDQHVKDYAVWLLRWHLRIDDRIRRWLK